MVDDKWKGGIDTHILICVCVDGRTYRYGTPHQILFCASTLFIHPIVPNSIKVPTIPVLIDMWSRSRFPDSDEPFHSSLCGHRNSAYAFSFLMPQCMFDPRDPKKNILHCSSRERVTWDKTLGISIPSLRKKNHSTFHTSAPRFVINLQRSIASLSTYRTYEREKRIDWISFSGCQAHPSPSPQISPIPAILLTRGRSYTSSQLRRGTEGVYL